MMSRNLECSTDEITAHRLALTTGSIGNELSPVSGSAMNLLQQCSDLLQCCPSSATASVKRELKLVCQTGIAVIRIKRVCRGGLNVQISDRLPEQEVPANLLCPAAAQETKHTKSTE